MPAKTKKVVSKIRRSRPQKRVSAHNKRRAQVKSVIKQSRPTHKKILLHPVTIFLLLCSAVYIARWTFMVHADSYTVSGKVAAPALTEGAVITSPQDGTIFNLTNKVTIEGSCPDSSYVSIERNGLMSGNAWCTAQNTFTIEVTLLQGNNNIRAQSYNITDDPGPVTSPISLIYNPPEPPTDNPNIVEPKTENNPDNSGSPAFSQPILITNFIYQAFEVNKTAVWHLEIQGGKEPYSLSVDWGDDHSNSESYSKAQIISLSHKYKKAGYYQIRAELHDANGTQYVLQLFAVIKSPIGAAAYSGNGMSNISSGWLESFSQKLTANNGLMVAWGSFTIVSLMSVSFWLGERQQINSLIRRKISRHRHA